MKSLDTTTPNTSLRRWNSIATSVVIPSKLSLPNKPFLTSSFPNGSAADDLELITIKPISYTSLKDLLPSSAASLHSPKPGGTGNEISIRNRLVKQAACAYLQPMSTSPAPSGPHFLHTMWVRFTCGDYLKSRVASFLRFVTRAFDRMLRAICVRNFR